MEFLGLLGSLDTGIFRKSCYTRILNGSVDNASGHVDTLRLKTGRQSLFRTPENSGIVNRRHMETRRMHVLSFRGVCNGRREG